MNAPMLPVPEPVLADPPDLGARTIMRQRWTDLAYLHWPYPPEAVQALLPPGLTVDTFEGDAWVGLIPFVMRGVRIGPLPPLPWLSQFVEINVRTYVVDEQGRRAIWFWSLDVPRSPIVAVARSCFSLPYCWSVGASHDVVTRDSATRDSATRDSATRDSATHDMDGDHHRYTMRRTWPGRGASADIAYTVGDRIPDDEVTDLDHFLSARWAMTTVRRGRIRYGRVHHERWPLHRAEGVTVTQDVIEAAGLPAPVGAPHVLCTPGVSVRIAWFER